MKILDMSFGRNSYHVSFYSSPLFEGALGIAAATYDEIHPTLEKPREYWQMMIEALPDRVQAELLYAKRHNTWKTLLQLLHTHPFPDLEAFLSFLENLPDQQLLYEALPCLGQEREEARRRAVEGDAAAVEELLAACSAHKFFPAYLSYLCQLDMGVLRRHLITLFQGWYTLHVMPREDELRRLLQRDCDQKSGMREKLSPEALVEWALGGAAYPPEPSISRVLLIPHTLYRPWTIQADAKGTKIFYYPVADENMAEEIDPYQPPLRLIQLYKAVGDEHRLRIIKFLTERAHSLQELTERMEMAKSTLHHHLSMLRSAQVIEMNGTRYQLRPHVLGQLPLFLDDYLGRG
ncbi:helix-turn-helix domain-containing protein [Brevibacillus ruminantium]|uniref:Helix-turn-helix domain-containing protein n=1 Tax=Brevibacillus ruminantium TaxID=2950604 RepID=A0ABY4WHV1_9BACL|nr:helix-turn-helix domain-containing protein [Brevibacillus ruminantium]USG66284.1 helix-turn-helix domain-containing protein [Brevibacillus ruminantium]